MCESEVRTNTSSEDMVFCNSGVRVWENVDGVGRGRGRGLYTFALLSQ